MTRCSLLGKILYCLLLLFGLFYLKLEFRSKTKNPGIEVPRDFWMKKIGKILTKLKFNCLFLMILFHKRSAMIAAIKLRLQNLISCQKNMKAQLRNFHFKLRCHQQKCYHCGKS